MPKQRFPVWLFCPVMIFAFLLHPAAFSFSVTLLEENDGFGFQGFGRPVSDNYYTQGAGLTVGWAHGPITRLRAGARQWVYSPDNITTSDLNVLRGDQPFAGWLVVFAGAERRYGPWTVDAELKAGAIGPMALGGSFQTAWHKAVRSFNGRESPPRPGGLGVYEIADAPGIDLEASMEHEVYRNGSGELHDGFSGLFKSAPGLRLSWSIGGEAGTVHGRMSLTAGGRAGYFQAETAPAVQSLSELCLVFRTGFFAAFRNNLLQGELIRGVPNETRLRRFGQEIQWGLSTRWKNVALFLGQTARTLELADLPPGVGAWHHYGRFEVTVYSGPERKTVKE